MSSRITGNSILIVEDETLLALMLEDVLLDAGHRVVHAATLPEAMDALDQDRFDAAILDINIGGKDVFPVASRLREMHTPFMFASAAEAASIGPEFRHEHLLPMPYTIAQVQRPLDSLLSRH